MSKDTHPEKKKRRKDKPKRQTPTVNEIQDDSRNSKKQTNMPYDAL